MSKRITTALAVVAGALPLAGGQALANAAPNCAPVRDETALQIQVNPELSAAIGEMASAENVQVFVRIFNGNYGQRVNAFPSEDCDDKSESHRISIFFNSLSELSFVDEDLDGSAAPLVSDAAKEALQHDLVDPKQPPQQDIAKFLKNILSLRRDVQVPAQDEPQSNNVQPVVFAQKFDSDNGNAYVSTILTDKDYAIAAGAALLVLAIAGAGALQIRRMKKEEQTA